MSHVPYRPPTLAPETALQRADSFYERMDQRRSVRFFSARPVPRTLVERAIQTASTAPSGAHKQPWTFVVIESAALKRQIREAAEAEEKESYTNRMSEEWLHALEPLGTNWEKPYLETVPWIVVLFAQRWGRDENGERVKHYYVNESCGIAAGMFIAALHNMGLATLTHTPSPMGFLSNLLERPDNEKPMIMFPIGYPSDDATVPDLTRKGLDQISVWK